MQKLRVLFSMTLILAAVPAVLHSQSVTGQISGTVTDSTGGSIAGAVVRLTHELSQQSRSFTTETSGSFVFTNLVPGAYNVRIEISGFRAYEQLRGRQSAADQLELRRDHQHADGVTARRSVMSLRIKF